MVEDGYYWCDIKCAMMIFVSPPIWGKKGQNTALRTATCLYMNNSKLNYITQQWIYE